MNWKEFAADYLHFTRRDRIGILALVTIILGVFFLPAAIPKQSAAVQMKTDTAWIAAMKRLEQKETNTGSNYPQFNEETSTAYQYDRYDNSRPGKTKGILFYFDPNTLPAAGWQQLGLREKTIRTIQNYLAKGGQFRKPDDLRRIYGLFPDEYERIAPYIQIGSAGATNPENELKLSPPNGGPVANRPASRYPVVDINTADSTALIALPGIGAKLSARIIRFRDKLGGFYAISQVGETFGLPDSTFQQIKHYLKLENSATRKININTATAVELKAHPYFTYSLANALIAYRNEHGSCSQPEDTRKVMAVTEEIYRKIAPYLATQYTIPVKVKHLFKHMHH